MTVTFRTIKTDVLARIARGDWAPDGALPNEVDLARQYGCARATVNRALRELAEDGVLERRRRSGTRVRAEPTRMARLEIPLVRREIEETGARYRYALVSRSEQPAPDWLRARLALDPGAAALHVTCMHYADGEPFQFEDRWLNLAALPEAGGVDFGAEGPNEWLLATVPVTTAEMAFTAEPAPAEIAAHLGCRAGDAIFVAERTTWFDGAAVTFVRLWFRRGHRMTTRY